MLRIAKLLKLYSSLHIIIISITIEILKCKLVCSIILDQAKKQYIKVLLVYKKQIVANETLRLSRIRAFTYICIVLYIGLQSNKLTRHNNNWEISRSTRTKSGPSDITGSITTTFKATSESNCLT